MVDFEEIWASFTGEFGAKGSKKRARIEYEKLKPDLFLQQEILWAIKNQHSEKMRLHKSGCFCENFQHVERWLRNKRWEDERGERVITGRKLSASERADEEAREYLRKRRSTC